MRHNRNKGFVSILVILLFVLIGLYSIVISGILRTMQHQTNQMLLDAKISNLQQSGVAFLKINQPVLENIELNLNDDSFKNSSLTISRNDNLIILNSECTIGQQKKTQKFQFETGKL